MALVVFVALVGALAAFGARTAHADEFKVTSPASGVPSDCEKVRADLDTCTFEDAVHDANANSNESRIIFGLDSVTAGQIQGVDTGRSNSIELPYTTTIDGSTQAVPGLPPGTPPISLGDATISLFTNADGSTIRGLLVGGRPGTINSYGGVIILGDTEDARIEGNWIGIGKTPETATGAPASVSCGGCAGAVIGGPDPEDRNVLSGNSGFGVWLDDAANVTVSGNYIGLAPDGTAAGNRGAGIKIDGSNGVTVGGVASGDGNVISGNGPVSPSTFEDVSGYGISIYDSRDVLLQGNRIGTNATGTAAIPNTGHGVEVRSLQAMSTDIAVGTPGHGNLISGNGSVTPGSGIGVLAATGNPNCCVAGPAAVTVQGNRIGTTANGTGSIPNRLDGVQAHIYYSRVTVGGSAPLAGNVIANSQTGFGVNVRGRFDGGSDAAEILGNSIYNNAKLGISLGGRTNPLANDQAAPPYDTDGGENERQNYPVLDLATSDNSQTTVSGELRTTSGIFRIEVFSNPSCDPSGNGEGRTFLGAFQAVSDGSMVEFTETVPIPVPEGDLAVTATATNTIGTPGKTSEFSTCISPTFNQVNGPPVASIDSYNTDQDTALTVPDGPTDVLANDTDPENNTLTAVKVSDPTSGSLTLNSNGSFTYTPNANFSGTDSFTYKANDGTNDSNVATATITVRPQATPPALTINDVKIKEGNGGTKNAVFTVQLDAPPSQEVTVDYATANASARSPKDYAATNGTLTFDQLTETISVPVNGDRRDERNEVFFVNLSDANNATVADTEGRGTIRDND